MTSLQGRIVSLQVGLPQKLITGAGREWRSAIAKQAVSGKVPLGPENFAGDYQANRKYHGGPDKAVCLYSAEHYAYWRDALADPDFSYGAFGENLTVEGLTEDAVCIGDIFTAGTAILQVSQPRQPCANVSKRWSRPDLPRRMEHTGFTGFYCRVVQTGETANGDALVLTKRPHGGWTLARANTLMYGEPVDVDGVTDLRAVPALSAEWKRILGRKLAADAPP